MSKDRRATATVLAVGKLNFLSNSNAIPRKWFTQLKLGNKTDAIGCLILSEIVFWYTPDFIKDEATGRTIEIRRRFDGDILQKNARQLAERFGFSETQIYDALTRLEKAGIIRKEIRSVETTSGVLPKVMFIHLNVERLRAVTEYTEDDLEALSPVGKSLSPTGDKLLPTDQKLLSTDKSESPTDGTTDNTTSNTTDNTTEREEFSLAFASERPALPLDIPFAKIAVAAEPEKANAATAQPNLLLLIQEEMPLSPNAGAPPSPEGGLSPVSAATPAQAQRKAATGSGQAKEDPTTFAALSVAYAAAVGHSAISWGQAAAGLKKLAKVNCTPEELNACYRWLKADPFWATKPVSTQTIFNQIGEWRRIQTRRAGSIELARLNEYGYIPTGTGRDAIEIYYESFAYSDKAARLDPRGEQDLREHCSELAKLRTVCEAYRRTTYKRGNLSLIIDWYVRGIPQHGATTNANHGYNRRAGSPVLPRSEGGYDPYAGCTSEQVAAAFRPSTEAEKARQQADYEQLVATVRANQERHRIVQLEEQRRGRPYTGH